MGKTDRGGGSAAEAGIHFLWAGVFGSRSEGDGRWHGQAAALWSATGRVILFGAWCEWLQEATHVKRQRFA